MTQQQQDTSLLLPAQLTLGIALSFTGEFAPALEHLAQDSTHYDLQRHQAYTLLYGQDPMVTCLTQAAWVLWHLGYPDQALKKGHEALTLARELAHPFSIAQSLCHTGWVHQFRREARATQEQSEALLALCSEQGFALWAALGTILRGWALAERGLEEGIAQIRQGLAAWQATGAEMFVPYFLALQAEAYGQEDQAEVGLSLLDEALAVAHKNGDRFYEAELYRLKGELLLNVSPELSPEACFRQAIDIARRQSARSLESRAVMNLSRLWQRQGKKEEARQMLAEIYNWFTEGFDTADLKEARALLEKMS